MYKCSSRAKGTISFTPATPLHAAAKGGVVSAPHGLASRSGAEVLARGGNAIEAAIAMAASLAVVYPHMTGLGGDAFWLIADRAGNIRGLDGAGLAGTACTPESYFSAGHRRIPERGPLAANTVPGALATWHEAYRYSAESWHGHVPWGDLLEDAVRQARDGFPISRSQSEALRDKLGTLGGDARFQDTFLPQGKLPRTGEHLTLPALAASLERLQSAGAMDFYHGALAQHAAHGLEECGSPLRRTDLSSYQSRWVQPLRYPYGKGVLLNLPPPTQGISSLMLLALMDSIDLADMDPFGSDYVHFAAEATKRVFALRDRYLGDPDFVAVPVREMLDPLRLGHLAAEIDRERASPWQQSLGPGDTVWFGAADTQGCCVSVIQSLYYEFGSGVIAGDTGILWQNRGCSFSLEEGHPNVLAPGKRPFHTLNPAMYSEHGRVRLAYGSMGGEGQPQTQAALASRILTFRMGLLEAIDAPRWVLGKTWGDPSPTLKLERGFSERVFEDLKRRGHSVEWVPRYSSLLGHAGAIRLDEAGNLEAASDPRSDGAAFGVDVLGGPT